MKRVVNTIAIGVALSLAAKAKADLNVVVDPTQNWIGYMNVSDLPSNGGAYEFGSVWGFNDLEAAFTPGLLTIGPNTSIDRDVPDNTYWWQDASGTSPGNKIMDASAYVESDAIAGQTIDFTGTVLANTLVSPYTSVAFIKDFASDYSSDTTTTVPLTAGAFSLSLPTTPGTHVQYGFETVGPDARLAMASMLGNVQIVAVTPVTTVVSQWNLSTGGDWNTASNWTNGIPNSVDSESDLFSALTTNGTLNTATAITLGTLNFNNTNTYMITGAGLTMQVSNGSAAVIVQAGTQQIALPLTLASNTNLNVSSGATLQISSPLTVNSGISLTKSGTGMVSYQSDVTLMSNASLAMDSSSSLGALSLGAGATLSIASTGTRALLQTTSLTLASTSTLNLANSDLIVHGGSISAVTAALQTGFNAGAWNGSGISSSTAAADPKHLMALGSISNNNGSGGALYGSGTALGLFDGTSPALNDVLVRFTYYGDANLDGKVDGSDYSKIDNGALNHLSGWQNGDFNYDGVVNGSDYTLIDNTFNSQGNQIAAAASLVLPTSLVAGTAAVPEPATLSLLCLGAASLLGRRRTR